MTDAFLITGVRVTHDRADLDTLEAAGFDDWRDRIEELLATDGVAEAAVLQTCNRVEEYVVTDSAETGREVISEFSDVSGGTVIEMDHGESLNHLLRVAAGLESQVLGEDQILGQIREAYTEADNLGALGDILEPAFLKAIHVGERARTETAINEGIVSLGSAAIDLAAAEQGLENATVGVIGAGKMARTVTKALPDQVTEVRVLNRSRERAERLGADVHPPVTCAGLAELPSHLAESEVVFSATASDNPIIDAETVADAGETLIIDLAQPRDVAAGAAERDGITVRDLDGLHSVTEATHEERREAAREVETIVDEEFDLLLDQYKRQRADAVIAGMYRGAEGIKDAELRRALDRLDLDTDEEEVIESLADSLVSQILAVPTKSLRDAAAEDDWETITTAIDLFDPTGGADTKALFETGDTGPGVTEETPADGSEGG